MEASFASDRETMTWTEFGVASRSLAQQVADSGFQPDLVLAIARGGLTVAGALAYALSVKNCFTMNVEFYTGVDERIDMPVMLPPMLDLVDIAGLKVLVADDVADTGMTLQLVHKVIDDQVGEARCAVLYQKPRSVIDCEYVFRRTDRWINFPWSTEPPVR
jgi:hypoxanthine phosphoribosyltransferase